MKSIAPWLGKIGVRVLDLTVSCVTPSEAIGINSLNAIAMLMTRFISDRYLTLVF